MTPIVAIANRKGGAGKTTTAVNLAAEWARQGLRTLVIDLDTQGHVEIGLGLGERKYDTPGVHDFLEGKCNFSDTVVPASIDNVWVSPANTDSLGSPQDPTLLRQAIRGGMVQQTYDRIVVDTPPTNDGNLRNALAASDALIVPFVPHHLAGVGVKQLAKLFYQVATKHNADLKTFLLLPVLYDRNIRLHRRVIDDLKMQFGEQRMLRGIRSNIKVAEAFSEGLPVCLHAPRSAGSMDYQLLARELETYFN